MCEPNQVFHTALIGWMGTTYQDYFWGPFIIIHDSSVLQYPLLGFLHLFELCTLKIYEVGYLEGHFFGRGAQFGWNLVESWHLPLCSAFLLAWTHVMSWQSHCPSFCPFVCVQSYNSLYNTLVCGWVSPTQNPYVGSWSHRLFIFREW
jgi:hypothetical protein